MKPLLIPSIIAHSQKEFEKRLAHVKSCKSIQIDVMDGDFVSQTSFEFDFKPVRGHEYEAHLMMQDPLGWIEKNHKKVKSIIVHYESSDKLHELIHEAKRFKKKIGIAIKHDTSAEAIEQYLHLVDKILVMTVDPGKYGSSFLPDMIWKVSEIRSLNKKIIIQVDGGITPSTIKDCLEAGASEFVVGSYLQKAKDVNKAVKELKNAINNS